MADVLNKRVVTLETQEGSAYGAALLAVVGTGAYGTVEECCRVAIRKLRAGACRDAQRSASRMHESARVISGDLSGAEAVYGRL